MFSTARVCWVEGAEVSLTLGGVVTASHSRDVVTCHEIIIIIIIITVISPSSSGIIHMPPDQMDQPGAAGRLRLREIRDRRIVWSEIWNHKYGPNKSILFTNRKAFIIYLELWTLR